MIKLKKALAGFLTLTGVLAASSAVVLPARADSGLDLWSDTYSESGVGYEAFNQIGMGKKDPRKIAAGVIQTALGFLGVIAVVLILVGGFQWMTAQGNDSKIDKAKKLMTAGVVGLLIVLASFAISLYIMRALLGITGATTSGGASYGND